MSAKKSTKKPVAKKANGAKKPNPLHDTLVKLMSRPNGATMHDTFNSGWNYPAMAAVRIVERRGYKVAVVKKDGELKRYIAKRVS